MFDVADLEPLNGGDQGRTKGSRDLDFVRSCAQFGSFRQQDDEFVLHSQWEITPPRWAWNNARR